MWGRREQSPWRDRLITGGKILGGLALAAGVVELGRRYLTRERIENAMGAVGIGGYSQPGEDLTPAFPADEAAGGAGLGEQLAEPVVPAPGERTEP